MRNEQIEVVPDISGILSQGTFEWGLVSNTGMVFKDETPESEWKRITENLCQLYEHTGKKNSQIAMMLGDALRFGEDKYGERYADVIDSTRAYMRVIGIKTLQNYQWIAGKIAPSRRHQNLSLAHHEAVAKLEPSEQDEFLKLAEDEAQTVKELRAAIRERHPGKPRTNKPKVTVSIDTDNPSAVTDALQIIANHLANPKTKWNDDWTEHTATIRSEHMRRMKRKMGPSQ